MIPWARPTLWGKEQAFVAEALASTWISDGAFVERFEQQVAGLCGHRHAVSASNGTTALEMVFLALGVGPGDEVIVPGFAFQAAANVAIRLGARPVFADVDRDTWCLDPAAVERCLSPRTKLVVPVHTYGNVCAVDRFVELAAGGPIAVVEDAAEAFGSTYRGQPAGAIAPCGTFSFQATKTITTGEGGMVVTTDPEVRDRMRLFRNHGMRVTRYRHEVAGLNFRMTNLQAAVGCAQLDALDSIIAERKRIHAQYQGLLAGAAGITLQAFPSTVEPVLWALAVRLDPTAYPQGRDAVMGALLEAGIEPRPGFYAASTMPHLYPDCAPIPVCDGLSREVVSLPTFAGLGADQIEMICATLLGLRR